MSNRRIVKNKLNYLINDSWYIQVIQKNVWYSTAIITESSLQISNCYFS